MKKFAKITLITSAVCFVTGAVILMIAAFFGSTSLFGQVFSGAARRYAGDRAGQRVGAEIREEIREEFRDAREELWDAGEELRGVREELREDFYELFGRNGGTVLAPRPEHHDTGVPDAGGSGAGVPGAVAPGAGVPNAGVPDAGVSAAGVPDAGGPGSGVPNADVPDAGVPDAGVPGGGAPDAGGPGAGTPNAGIPDSGVPDAGVPDYSYSEINELEICVEMGTVEIVETETSGSVEVTLYSDQMRVFPTLRDEGNRRELELEFSVTGQGLAIGNGDGAAARVTVPAGYTFDLLDLDVEAGIISAETVSARRLDISSEAGTVTVNRASADQVELDTEAGTVEVCLAGNETDYNLQIDCEITGWVTVGERDFNGYGETRYITNPGANRRVDADCEAGMITIRFVP